MEAEVLAALKQRLSGHAEADRWGPLLVPLPLPSLLLPLLVVVVVVAK
jgi:hypothetical protein